MKGWNGVHQEDEHEEWGMISGIRRVGYDEWDMQQKLYAH